MLRFARFFVVLAHALTLAEDPIGVEVEKCMYDVLVSVVRESMRF